MNQHLRSTKLRQLRAAIALGLGVACAAIGTAQADGELEQTAKVGEVSLVLGKAFVVSEGEKPKRLMAGMQIGVNDHIVTESNGHVHVRFVDDALVSVRPDSRLEILNYEYNAANPQNSSVKLNLLEGVTRAISGDAAKSARDRFRMNTPIAAIGVRGTDFVVSASGQSVRALVNEGAIVMAPYSTDCLQDAFGPCAVNGVELTQSTMQAVEVAENSASPRVIQIPRDEESTSDNRVQVAEVENSDADAEEERVEDVEVYSENIASQRVDELTLTTAGTDPDGPVILEPVDVTPAEPVPVEELDARQLVWGRWSDTLGSAERITVSLAEDAGDVSEGRERFISVLSSGSYYSLYRPIEDTARPDRDLTVVSFGLSSAQAFYHSASGVAAMEVNDGSLEIDFVGRSFATDLSLNSDATGALGFSATGRLQDAGNFYDITDSQEIRGATSIDGSEAGYFFQKQVDDGTVQGLTLWDVQ
ncbi:MAG: FecR family protein [Pseudohongiellaceae bacterium]|nr:FecR family protein [Pseudohongiellaceae bacterium]